MTTHTHAFPTPATFGHPLADWIRRVQAHRTRRRDIALTWRAMRKLDPATLRDIGLEVSEIGDVTAFDRLMSRN